MTFVQLGVGALIGACVGAGFRILLDPTHDIHIAWTMLLFVLLVWTALFLALPWKATRLDLVLQS